MSSYYVMGRAFVERREPEQDSIDPGEYEVLWRDATASSPFVEETMEFDDTIFDDSDIPAEPGMYAIMYCARLTGKQDYWGEWDVDVEMEWMKVVRQSDEEAAAIIERVEWENEHGTGN